MNRGLTIPAVIALALLAATSAAPPAGAGPATLTLDPEAQACLALAARDPAAALAQAAALEPRQPGPARLCRATADFQAGRFAPAAQTLEGLVPLLGAGDTKVAADLWNRAGWAWLRAGEAAKAERAMTQALERQPGDPDLRLDRALARADARRWKEAVSDLDLVLKQRPERAEAWLYRAVARKALQDYAGAEQDAERALKLQPDEVEALLLRGNLKARRGDAEGAAADWQRIIAVAPAGSTAVRSAKSNLDQLSESRKENKKKP